MDARPNQRNKDLFPNFNSVAWKPSSKVNWACEGEHHLKVRFLCFVSRLFLLFLCAVLLFFFCLFFVLICVLHFFVLVFVLLLLANSSLAYRDYFALAGSRTQFVGNSCEEVALPQFLLVTCIH